MAGIDTSEVNDTVNRSGSTGNKSDKRWESAKIEAFISFELGMWWNYIMCTLFSLFIFYLELLYAIFMFCLIVEESVEKKTEVRPIFLLVGSRKGLFHL